MALDHHHGHGHHDHHHGHADHDHRHADHGHDHQSSGAPAGAFGSGELATPTGMALVRTLAADWGPQPALVTSAIGIGAGSKDTRGRPNVVRVIVGTPATGWPPVEVVTLSANVDDLDPRLWPGVLSGLLEAGALDAWLIPIAMKKGRPGHLLQVLAEPADAAALTSVILAGTSTFGVRQDAGAWRTVLQRDWHRVEVAGQPVRIKLGRRAGRLLSATPEWCDVAAAARASGRTEREILQLAQAAAARLLATADEGSAWRDGLGHPAADMP